MVAVVKWIKAIEVVNKIVGIGEIKKFNVYKETSRNNFITHLNITETI
jgi:hypothetical protein